MGTYTYGSALKPHAVTAVDNASGDIDYNSQDVSYNNWNRVSSVWQYYDDDCYGYSIEYGPDLKRVRSQLHTYNNLIYDMFYWDDYEEKTVGTDTLKCYYLYTSEELDALHIIKSSPSGVSSHTTKVLTDHQGSIEGLADYPYMAYQATFDAWGNRDVYIPYWFDRTFNRGYTGHEHIDELGLINMNGRMYDPRLGRFLSPDPFVQAPSNPQNYNRYTYCLNNPLKYTDPSGEKISWLWGLGVALNIIPIESAMAFVTCSITDAINAGIFGLLDGGTHEAANRFSNSIKLSTATLQSDDTDGGELAQFARSYFRSVWCSPISLLGYLYSVGANYFGKTDVDTYYGATVLRTSWSTSGVTMGHYILINSDYDDKYYKSTLIHEYGHFCQARNWGGFSAMSGGIFSLLSAANIVQVNKGHEEMWIEKDASARGLNHLKNKLTQDEIRRFNIDNNPQEFYEYRMLHNLFIPFSILFGIYNICNPN